MERLNIAIFAAVLVVFAATLSPVDAGAKKAVDACMQQSGATKADMEKFMKTDEASQPLKCMMSCTLQAIKFMTADGTIDTAYTKSNMPSAVGSLVDTCASKAQPEAEICSRAYTFLRCFVKAEPKIFIEFTTTD